MPFRLTTLPSSRRNSQLDRVKRCRRNLFTPIIRISSSSALFVHSCCRLLPFFHLPFKVPEYCYSTPVFDADSPVKSTSSSSSKQTASNKNAPGTPLRLKVRVAGWQKDFGLGPSANCESSHGLTDTHSIGDFKVKQRVLFFCLVFGIVFCICGQVISVPF